MTLDSLSMLNTQTNVQSFMGKLLLESVKEFTSTNFNSQNVIVSFHYSIWWKFVPS